MPIRVTGLALILGAVVCGLSGAWWCLNEHDCMAGHMMHPPYPVWHYAVDVLWPLCFLAAPCMAFHFQVMVLRWFTLPLPFMLFWWMHYAVHIF